MSSDLLTTVTRPILPLPQPTFESPRLTFRPITAADVPAFHSMRNQLPVMRFLNDPQGDPTPAATLSWMEKLLPPNHNKVFFLAVVLKENNKFIGAIGRHIPEPPECAYIFRLEEWGKGYATEALEAWLGAYWALPRKEILIEEAGELRVYDGPEPKDKTEVLLGTTNEQNGASIRVLEKAGFRERRRYMLQEQPMIEWVLNPPSDTGTSERALR